MADNLQWIRFANGKEKQVPAHIALDPSVQKSQNFQPINGAGGHTLQPGSVRVPQKKNVAVVSPAKQEPASGTGLSPAGDPAKELYEQHKAGSSFAEIAKGRGIHWRAVEKQVKEYMQANNIVDQTPTE